MDVKGKREVGGGRVFVGSATGEGNELIWKSGRANEHADQFGGRQGRFDSLPSDGEWGLVIGQIKLGQWLADLADLADLGLSESPLPDRPITVQDQYL